jgi:hypothetical protein
MKINYGLVAVAAEDKNKDKVRILHFCGYEEEPTEVEINSLKEELQTFQEFGLVGIDFCLAHATPEIVEFYRSRF